MREKQRGMIFLSIIDYYFSVRSPLTAKILDQFSFLGNRARYEFIELDMSTVLDLSIPSSRPLTFPGEQSKNGYRARGLIELGFSREEKKRKNGN